MSLNPSTEKVIELLAQKLYNERKQNHKYDKNVAHLSSLASRISDKKNNTSKPNSRRISINDPSLLIKDNEITDSLKEFAKEIFHRCDLDKDGLLNTKEYNNYFRLIDMDPLYINISKF
ncbi:hypothetical protein H8356DRAFT_1081534 [Neocallimastix lanati (nom. inval.)]|uniref:EF-hand domain-containing protein n=1 Tax=Neocallimastix californiae TaxID=1754190 RepID=A0A1Y2ELK5_9FUNG|nr:hypothetical protein H8356DRAFT_1081534 [Neocallimastix sp. JGI-2020a]ORY72460.1 hypothetical protein LY90DRAFT_503690 [Neocallimastix californiae]|eukprot:ORY72460.1 hypothetical protein LY90DRAFT_503690 [Neocallimastix californiae]